ncbi:hypothetical protein GCM10022247_55940 [Allokutzneria multivorans]|uniref:Uncharacterized protein n=1 Tax=Allokutzneria multivorans TaxID=1142134 RepID=A0ABP7TCC5_9PSEU
MSLSTNADEHQVREFTCGCCAAPAQRTWNFVLRDGSPHAVYFANSYNHGGQGHETWIDVILGSWGGENHSDHVTFGCRVGAVEDSPAPAATAVQACLDGSAGPLHGRTLSREEALAHPWITDFWAVVDHVLEHDPVVHPHLYG